MSLEWSISLSPLKLDIYGLFVSSRMQYLTAFLLQSNLIINREQNNEIITVPGYQLSAIFNCFMFVSKKLFKFSFFSKHWTVKSVATFIVLLNQHVYSVTLVLKEKAKLE